MWSDVLRNKKKINRKTNYLTTLRRTGSRDEQSFCRLSTFSASIITLHRRVYFLRNSFVIKHKEESMKRASRVKILDFPEYIYNNENYIVQDMFFSFSILLKASYVLTKGADHKNSLEAAGVYLPRLAYLQHWVDFTINIKIITNLRTKQLSTLRMNKA